MKQGSCPIGENLSREINCTAFSSGLADATDHKWRCEINCTALTELVRTFVNASQAPNTSRAYKSDIANFLRWGGDIPATPELVAAYLAAHARSHAISSLTHYLASLSKAHRARSLPNPTSSELVKATMRGIRRSQVSADGSGPAKPLLREDLVRVLDPIGTSLTDHRDRALLLLGFAGAFRRSELAGLDIADVDLAQGGVKIFVRRSKTDRYGDGQSVWIASGQTRNCPALALEKWIAISGIKDGPLFRPIHKSGRLISDCLSGEAVSIILKRRMISAGLNTEGFSGHSLRAGFVTSAALVGTPIWMIREHTRHATDLSVARYIRPNWPLRNSKIEALL